MADLIARGKDVGDHWRRTLPEGPFTLGRSAVKSTWDVSWDPCISRRCATLVWQDNRLQVCKEADATSLINYRGKNVPEFSLAVGETFVIGGTTFQLVESVTNRAGPSTEQLLQDENFMEFAFSHRDLARFKEVKTDQRIEVLALLAEMARYSLNEEDPDARVVDVLLQGIPTASVAAVVRLKMEADGEEPTVEILFAKGRDDVATSLFQASRRLILHSIQRRRQSMMHVWLGGESSGEFTGPAQFDWAICAPLRDDPYQGWAFYITGLQGLKHAAAPKEVREGYLKSDLQFAGLVADIYCSFRQIRELQHRQVHLGSFLSRPVRAALAKSDIDEVLSPRETEVSVLFCDLRGSCRIVDQSQQSLSELWSRVSEALSVMTNAILDQDGVIGDFQGDAALGFWGWPLEGKDYAERAARAALMIARRFAQFARQRNSPLAGFQCGLGIATGPAVAGRLGTEDQYKVGVFGHVVNLASRLESLTKYFQVPILIDERTAELLRGPGTSHWVRRRRLARLRPVGMQSGLTVSELLPAYVPGEMPEGNRLDYEAALEAFLAGDWSHARSLFKRLPMEQPIKILLNFIDLHNQEPPPGWDGVIVMETK